RVVVGFTAELQQDAGRNRRCFRGRALSEWLLVARCGLLGGRCFQCSCFLWASAGASEVSIACTRLHSARVLWPQVLLSDGQRALEGRCRLLVVALLGVEDGRAVERAGQSEMLRSHSLLADP